MVVAGNQTSRGYDRRTNRLQLGIKLPTERGQNVLGVVVSHHSLQVVMLEDMRGHNCHDFCICVLKNSLNTVGGVLVQRQDNYVLGCVRTSKNITSERKSEMLAM